MSEILPIGSILATDAQGYLVTDCALEKIVSPWKEAVEWARDILVGRLGADLHSVYLRGSVPRGAARAGVSDLDILVVTRREIQDLDLRWTREALGQFKAAFPFAKYLDLDFVPLEKLLNATAYVSKRFTVKVNALCIHGEDLALQLKPFKPSRKVAFFFHGNLREVLQNTAERLQISANPEVIQGSCAWVMKRLVRTGFGLVMETAGVYTRDLYPCYEIFSKHYPDREPQMRQALEWAIHPTSDKATILKFLDEFGTWMVEEARRVW